MRAFHKAIGKQGIGISILEVGVGNIPAQRLYEKLGYERIEMLEGYYRGREDAYRMLRREPQIAQTSQKTLL
jgi:ribosomal protein S18 acetylase RimI-like enzyme